MKTLASQEIKNHHAWDAEDLENMSRNEDVFDREMRDREVERSIIRGS